MIKESNWTFLLVALSICSILLAFTIFVLKLKNKTAISQKSLRAYQRDIDSCFDVQNVSKLSTKPNDEKLEIKYSKVEVSKKKKNNMSSSNNQNDNFVEIPL